MKTNAAYIHEFSILDDINETISEVTNEVNHAMYEYETSKRQDDLRSFFENYNEDFIMEKEGIFTRIGNAIIKLIKKIGDVISKFTDKFFHRSKEVETDEQVVNQIVSRNPELRSTVVKGLKNEWFTYKDVAKYKDDILGLSMMLEQQTIDHKTFKQKCGEALDKFNKSGTAIITAGATIAGVLTILPKIVNAFKRNKKALGDTKGALGSLSKKAETASPQTPAPQTTTEAANGKITPETVSTILSEISKATSVMSEELNRVSNSQINIDDVLKMFIKQYGQAKTPDSEQKD